VRARRLRDLDRVRADAARRADDQDAFAGRELCGVDRLDGGATGDREDRRLIERQ
jgi:hypothetical protein